MSLPDDDSEGYLGRGIKNINIEGEAISCWGSTVQRVTRNPGDTPVYARPFREDSVFDALMDALSNRHRRRVLVTLLNHGPPEGGGLELRDVIRLSDEPPEHLEVKMVHIHLPKLVAMDLVRWDRETDTLTEGQGFETVRPFMELLDDHRDELPQGWL
jgi:hypothetical protein